MKQPTAEPEPAAVTRLRRRLLAPLRRAGELTQNLVAARNATDRALRTRLAKLVDVGSSAMAAATAAAVGRLDLPRSSESRVGEHRIDTDPKTSLTRGDDERPPRSTDEAASVPATAEERSQSTASDANSDQASVPSDGHQREEWSPAQRTALEVAARRAAEEALRPVRNDQRALAEDMRACRAEPPAFQ